MQLEEIPENDTELNGMDFAGEVAEPEYGDIDVSDKAKMPEADEEVYETGSPDTITADEAGTGKNLQLEASALEDNAGESGAATVYYGKNNQTWRVIGYGTAGVASGDGKLALLASSTMGSDTEFNPVQNEQDSNNYKDSSLQTAMNNLLIDTFFSEKERNIIAPRDLIVEEYVAYAPHSDGVSGSDVPSQSLWPLSTNEADILYDNAGEITVINNNWWLRSPGSNYLQAAGVYKEGATFYGENNVFYGGFTVSALEGVRPAFNLNLSSIIFTSAAEGGKDPGNTFGTLNEVAAYTGTAWKLTLLDSARSGFGASVSDTEVTTVTEGYQNWPVSVSYSGAKTGDDSEHVSAILTDSDGKALYYGYIATNSGSSTGTTVTIPTGLSAGQYKLKVFNEQVNGTDGNYATDFSSELIDVASYDFCLAPVLGDDNVFVALMALALAVLSIALTVAMILYVKKSTDVSLKPN